jgi:hypothetical protein
MPTVEPMPDEVIAELDMVVPAGAALLGVDVDDEPKSIVAAIDKYVDEHLADEIDHDVIISLGALLGQQYVREFGWQWVELVYGEDDTVYSVVDPAHQIGNHPLVWVLRVVEQGHELNFLLNFNMVAAGNVPPPRDDGPVMLT